MPNANTSARQALALVAFERSPIGMLAVDAAGCIVAVNRELECTLGYEKGELIGKSVELLVPAKYAAVHPSLRSAFAAAPEHRRMGAGRELFARHRDGHEVPVEIGLSPVEVDGESLVLATIVDITERKQFEAHLRQAQKLETIGNLASGIAHEFNNVLHGILGYAELVRESLADRPDVSADMDVIIDTVARGRDLVTRILLFARKGEPARKTSWIEPTLRETMQLLRATLPHRVAIRIHVDPATPEVVADATELNQIVMNLANNAAHAMGSKGGQIDIHAGPMLVDAAMAAVYRSLHPGVYVCMSVIDTGSGMAPELVERIFEPFFTTKPAGEGTGLGLSMIQQIVKGFGGAIDVQSRLGHGTRFDVYIPVAQAIAADAAEQATEANRKRILYVDDEERLAQLGRRLLQSAGFDVIAHTSSLQALTDFRARPHTFDLVISDNNMPHMTGLELIDAIMSIRPNVPVLMVSGTGDTVDPSVLRSRGIRRVLAKPYSSADLRSAVQDLLVG